MTVVGDYGAERPDYYMDMILRMNLSELMNDDLVSRPTDRFLWRLELALGEIPMGHYIGDGGKRPLFGPPLALVRFGPLWTMRPWSGRNMKKTARALKRPRTIIRAR